MGKFDKALLLPAFQTQSLSVVGDFVSHHCSALGKTLLLLAFGKWGTCSDSPPLSLLDRNKPC